MAKASHSKAIGEGHGGQDATTSAGQPVEATEPSTPDLEMMCKTLIAIQDQIKFADTKASFIAGLNVLLFGFVVSNADKLATVPPASRAWAFYCASVLLILYGGSSLVSMVHVVLTIMPRFGDLAPQSRTHFAHILKGFGKDYGKYCKEVQGMTPCDWAEDVGTQIVEISHIAQTKHRLVRWASVWTLVALLFWVGGLIAVLVAH